MCPSIMKSNKKYIYNTPTRTPQPKKPPLNANTNAQVVLAINSNAFAGDLPPRLEPPPPPPLPNPLMSAAAAAAAAAQTQGAAAVAAARHARQYALNVHPEAAAAVARGAPKAPGLELECDGARGTWISPNAMLMGLKTGQLVVISLRFDGSSTTATKISVTPVGGGPVISGACCLGPTLVFLGSWAGDSLLVRCTSPVALAAATANAGAGAGGQKAPAAKKRRLSRLASIDMGGDEEGGDSKRTATAAAAAAVAAVAGEGEEGEGEEGDDVYRAALGRAASVSTVAAAAAVADGGRYSLKVCIALVCMVGLGWCVWSV